MNLANLLLSRQSEQGSRSGPCYDFGPMLRRFLIVLLVFALPVQAALASSRWLCVAMSTQTPPAAAVDEHAHHGDAKHGTTHDGGASHDHGPDAGHGDGGCSLCAACTVTAATPPVAVTLATVAHSSARIPSLDASVPRFGTDGPERPPRTV